MAGNNYHKLPFSGTEVERRLSDIATVKQLAESALSASDSAQKIAQSVRNDASADIATVKQLAESALSASDSAQKIAQSVRNDADNGKFNGADGDVNVQVDWEQTDDAQDDYIRNKPQKAIIINQDSTDEQYATAKAVYDYVSGYKIHPSVDGIIHVEGETLVFSETMGASVDGECLSLPYLTI